MLEQVGTRTWVTLVALGNVTIRGKNELDFFKD